MFCNARVVALLRDLFDQFQADWPLYQALSPSLSAACLLFCLWWKGPLFSSLEEGKLQSRKKCSFLPVTPFPFLNQSINMV